MLQELNELIDSLPPELKEKLKKEVPEVNEISFHLKSIERAEGEIVNYIEKAKRSSNGAYGLVLNIVSKLIDAADLEIRMATKVRHQNNQPMTGDVAAMVLASELRRQAVELEEMGKQAEEYFKSKVN